jgi:hypothetical protein
VLVILVAFYDIDRRKGEVLFFYSYVRLPTYKILIVTSQNTDSNRILIEGCNLNNRQINDGTNEQVIIV